MKSLLLGLAVASLAVVPAAAQCSFGMAHASKGKPTQYLAMTPAKPDASKQTMQTASLSDGWLVKYLEEPIS